ncbi:MAG: YeeE/YedE thiosulfate transporter family protein [Candidatus Hydrogenedentota bacterium]
MHPYLAGLLGGVLIGIAAAFLWAMLGRVAGISGILAGLLRGAPGWRWQLPFLCGLISAGAGFSFMGFTVFEPINRSMAALIVSGLLVGFGTRMAGGCTSGHGVCGISRFSRRSIVATLTFMGAGAAAVFVVNRILGGSV